MGAAARSSLSRTSRSLLRPVEVVKFVPALAGIYGQADTLLVAAIPVTYQGQELLVETTCSRISCIATEYNSGANLERESVVLAGRRQFHRRGRDTGARLSGGTTSLRWQHDEDVDVPLLRWGCTHLAIAMAGNGLDAEPAFARWVGNASQNPLPEVRNARLPKWPKLTTGQ